MNEPQAAFPNERRKQMPDGKNGGGNGNGAPPRELFDVETAARFLGLASASALYHMKAAGKFAGFGVVIKIGRRTLYSRSGLMKFIEAHRI